MTVSQYGDIQNAFLISYVISFLVGGWIIDRIGVRWGMALAITWWSVAEIYHGFAQSPRDLMIARALFGLAYPGAYIAAAKAVAEWYPPSERGFGTGLYTAGATIGATVAPPLITWITLQYNWRYTFFITGSAGLAYVVAWLVLYRAPEDHRWLGQAERSYILSGREEAAKHRAVGKSTLKEALRDRHFWAVAVGRFLGDNSWWFYVAWIPLFLSKSHGLEFKEIGLITWIPFLFADLGSLGGGWVSGRLVKRGWSVLRARLLVMLCCACLTVFSFSLGVLSSPALIIAMMSLLTFSIMAWMVNIVTIPVDAFSENLVGRVTGLTTVAAILGQMGINTIATHCSESDNFFTLFAIMSCTTPCAFVVVYLILRRSPLFSGKERNHESHE